MSKEMAGRKRVIIREAAGLFRKKGYRAATLREIAKQAGIKGGSIYYHFASKQDILFEIMDCGMQELIEYVSNGINDYDGSETQLREAIVRHIRYHIDNIAEMFVTDWELRSLTPDNYFKIIQKRKTYERLFIHIIQKGVERGVFDCPRINVTVYGILQMCTGVTVWYRRKGPLSAEEIGEIYFYLFLNGLGAQSPTDKQPEQTC